MAEEVYKGPFIGPAGKDPLAEFTSGVERTHSNRILAPEAFPRLFRIHPGLEAAYREAKMSQGRASLVTAFYNSAPISHDAFFTLPLPDIDPAALVYRQHGMVFPGLTIKLVNRFRDAGHDFQTKVIRSFSHDDREQEGPDLQSGVTASSTPEPAVNIMLALKLTQAGITDTEGKTIRTPQQLIKYSEARGVVLNKALLRQGWIDLLGHEIITTLRSRGIINDPAMADFYKNAALWQANLALVTQTDKWSYSGNFPYYFRDLKDNQLPEAYFLPFLLSGYAWLFYQLPELVPHRQSLEYRALRDHLQSLFNFSNKALQEQVHRHPDQKRRCIILGQTINRGIAPVLISIVDQEFARNRTLIANSNNTKEGRTNQVRADVVEAFKNRFRQRVQETWEIARSTLS